MAGAAAARQARAARVALMAAGWDWIARAGVPSEVTRRLRGGSRLRRALHRLTGVDTALAALDDALAWQRARVDYLESLLVGVAHSRPARAWLGAGERPVLLLGTGGGGTRVLAETAARLGVVLGTRVNESFDSVEWAPFVYRAAIEAGAASASAPDALTRDRIRSTAADIYAAWLSPVGRWGVKLPELLLLLPAFLDAFPQAQVVWLTRHPLGAALRRSHVTTQPQHPLGRIVLEAAYRAAGRDPRQAPRDPQYRRNALAWRYQTEQASAQLASLPAAQRLHLRLEDFGDGGDAAARLAAFLDVPPLRVPPEIDAARLSIPRDDPHAPEILACCGELARQLGYSAG